MAYNVPTYDVHKISIGPGTILLGPYNPTAAGSTPSVDVGAVQDNATIVVTRTKVPILQGVPRREIKAYVSKEELQVTFTGIEWNLPSLFRAVGGGVAPTTSGATTTWNFGSDPLMTDVSLQYQHITADGGTITLRLWKCRGSGALNITIPTDNLHTFAYTFDGVEGLSDWVNAGLPTNGKLFQIVQVSAP